MLTVGTLHGAEKNDGVSAFAAADIVAPENLHEVARFRLREIAEIASKSELMKQARGAGSVRVPAPPNAFAVVLVAND